ncbi:hypothetical protein I79_012502 [Cricetulus griseus]|uniref:Uncharacterized protein n=1 Tax=Cricetulus griseus TaxID=10029 RepID=G3HP01_CRIGR|nr:hypothetical protein I79_012502 [Cricetulus griseus]
MCAPLCLSLRGGALLLGERTPRPQSNIPPGSLPCTLCNWWHEAQNNFTEDSRAGQLDSKDEGVSSLPQWSECRREPSDSPILCWDKDDDDPKEQKRMGTTVPNNLGPRQQWFDTSPFPPVLAVSMAAYRCGQERRGFPEALKSRFASKNGKEERQLCIVPWSLYPYQLTFYFKFLVHFQ